MDLNLQILDMVGAQPEHSTVEDGKPPSFPTVKITFDDVFEEVEL